MLAEDPAPRLPTTASERRILTLFASALVALMVADITSGFNHLKLSIVFALVAWAPLLVLHECGHAAAARLVGWRVSEIVIGFGRELGRFRVGQTRIRLLAAPVAGYVVPSPTGTRHARLKSAWIYAAGPGIELVYVGLCWACFGSAFLEPSDDLWTLAVQSSCMAALLGAGFNLLPYVSGNSASDGMGILASLSRGDESFRSQLAAPFVSQARTEILQENPDKAAKWCDFGLEQYPDDWQLRSTRAVCLAAQGHAAAAIETLEALGDLDEKPPEVRLELLLDAAWTVLLSGDSSLLLDAQRACERALRLAPGHVRGCLLFGRVLLARTRPDDAFSELMNGYKLTRDQDYEAPLIVYLTLACRNADKPEFAARFLAEAKRRTLPAGLGAVLEAADQEHANRAP